MEKPISSDTQESIRQPSYVSEGGSFDIESPQKRTKIIEYWNCYFPSCKLTNSLQMMDNMGSLQ